MARARIRANSPLPGHPRGDEWEIELTDRDLKRAASGQISIVSTWDDDDGLTLTERVEDATVDEVLGWVRSGEVDAAVALQAELDGKQRRGIVDKLAPPEDGTGSPQAGAEGDPGVMGSDGGSGPAEGN